MANILTGKYLYFHTTTLASITGWHRILGIYWVSYTGAGLDIAVNDVFLLSDSNGLKITGKMAKAVGDGLEINFPPPGRQVDGITVTTLGGGVCFIHLEDEVLS